MRPQTAKMPDRERPCSGKVRLALVAVGLACLTALVFIPALQCGFIRNYDDSIYVLDNPVVSRGLTLAGLRWALTTGVGGNWHPVTWVSHMADVTMYGLEPRGHHASSIWLHACNAALLFLALVSLIRGGRPGGAGGAREAEEDLGIFCCCALVTAIFALHPLRVESVVWVSERKDLLCAFFAFLALWAYGNYATAARVSGAPRKAWRWYGITLLLFVLGLMSKPMLVTFPFLLLLLDYWPLGRLQGRRHVISLFREKVPFLILAAAFCVLAFAMQDRAHAVHTVARFPLDVRIENAANAYVTYVRKLFWPGALSFHYTHPGAGLPVWKWGGGIVLLAATTVWAIRMAWSMPYVFVGWFWFLGLLVPVIGLVQIGDQGMADRYTYLPHVGLIIALVWGTHAWFRRGPFGRQAAGQVRSLVAIGLLVAFAIGTRSEIPWWRDERTLYRRALALDPSNVIAHFNLGGVLLADRELPGALTHLRRAQELRPDDPAIQNSLGVALLLAGDVSGAAAQFSRVITLHPRRADAWNNLGRTLISAGDTERARACFREALRLRPDLETARQNMEALPVERGR